MCVNFMGHWTAISKICSCYTALLPNRDAVLRFGRAAISPLRHSIQFRWQLTTVFVDRENRDRPSHFTFNSCTNSNNSTRNRIRSSNPSPQEFVLILLWRSFLQYGSIQWVYSFFPQLSVIPSHTDPRPRRNRISAKLHLWYFYTMIRY